MNCVFITGANRGIGLSLVEHYVSQGWKVHATYRDESASQALLTLAKQHDNLVCHAFDVTDYSALGRLASALPAIDLLIANAGYYGPSGYGFGDTDVEEWRKVLEINTIAPLKMVEAFRPLLEKGRLKKVACISSKVGSMTENTSGGGYIYRSSKAALNSVVKSLSHDLASRGFTVVALHPGWVQTDMGGPEALITAEVSAQGVARVIDEVTPDNSGEFISYDGSRLAW